MTLSLSALPRDFGFHVLGDDSRMHLGLALIGLMPFDLALQRVIASTPGNPATSKSQISSQ